MSFLAIFRLFGVPRTTSVFLENNFFEAKRIEHVCAILVSECPFIFEEAEKIIDFRIYKNNEIKYKQ